MIHVAFTGDIHCCVFRWKPTAAAMVCQGSHRGIPRQPTWYSTGDHGRPWVPMAVAMGAHGRPRDPTAASGTPREDRGMSWQLPLACTVCTRAGSRECSGGNTHGAHDVGAHAAAHVGCHVGSRVGCRVGSRVGSHVVVRYNAHTVLLIYSGVGLSLIHI